MRLRGLLVVLGLVLLAADARAEWSVGAGPDFFSWTEHTAPIEVKETGTLAGLRGSLYGDFENEFHLEFRARVYFGRVEYNGSLLYDPTVPVTGNTHYVGTNFQAQFRHPLFRPVHVVWGFDYDVWSRTLGSDQVEDYQIFSIRMGVEHPISTSAPWRVGAGFKFSLLTHEDAHFDDLGFSSNPKLQPGNSVSPYLDLDYALSPHWSIGGSYDGFSFDASKKVDLVAGGTPVTFYQPASDMRIVSLRLEYR